MRVAALPGSQGKRGWVRRLHRKILIAVLLLTVAGVYLAGEMHDAVVESGRGHIYDVNGAPSRRVAVVFGARIFSDGDVSAHLARRLQAALELYRAGKVKKILVSGDNRWDHYNEPERMREWLLAQGVPEEDVACDYAGRRTLDTCARAEGVWGVKKPILVTQRYHLPRALYLAQHFGMDAVGVSCDGAGWNYGRKMALRETCARVLAWMDVNVLNRKPAIWGKPEAM